MREPFQMMNWIRIFKGRGRHSGMLDLEWSPDALDDLDAIWDNIAVNDIDAADSFIERIREEAKKICKIPKSGTVIEEFENDNFREIFYKGYTIVYEIKGNVILVHEVFNQKRVFIRSYRRYL
jgi:plasmid stabilization system protein ParE